MIERLERRDLPTTLPGFLAATGFGTTGAGSAIHANAVATDPAGDTVVTGSFRGTATFGTASAGAAFTTANTQDTFVARYSPTGSLLWVRTFAGQTTTTTTSSGSLTTYAVGQGSAVALDAAGDVLLAGSFQGTVNFGTAATPNLATSPATNDAFLVKLDSAGNTVWERAVTPVGGDDQGLALALDGTGGVVIAGSFVQGVTIGPTTLSGNGASEAFAARYDIATAAPTWAFGTQGTAGSNAQATGVAVDSAGNCVLAGFYSGTLSVGDGSSAQTFTAAGSDDVLIWKLDPQGKLLWARSFGSPDYDVAGGVTLDSGNNIAVVGTFSDTVNFATGSIPDVLTAGPVFDTFVLKLDPNGQEIWSRGFVGSSGWAKGQAIVADSTNGLHVVGTFTGTTDFDPGAGITAFTSVGATDAFAVGLDASGKFVYAVQAGRAGVNANLGVAVNPAGNIALTGNYGSSIAFGPIVIPSAGTSSSFVARLQTQPTAAPAAPILDASSQTGTGNTTSIPTPTFDLTTTDPTNTVELLRDGVIVAQRVGTGTLVDPGPITAGVHQYSAVQVSLASISSAASPATAVTFVFAPPAAPTNLGLASADDSGAIGDGITNVRQPHLTGHATAGLVVRVSTGLGTLLGTTTAGSDGSFSVLLPGLADGAYDLQAVAVNSAASVSASSTPFHLIILTTPPAPPTGLALLAADDSGIVGDGLTNVRAPRVSGKAVAGTTVQLVTPAGVLLGSATAGSDGSFVVPLGSFTDGTYNLQAIAVDAAGNASVKSNFFNLTILTAPPSAPTTPSLLAADDSGVIGDGLTNVRNPRITGTAGAGATVRIINASGTILATTTATAVGTYTATLNPLTDGTYSLQAVAVDAAANQSVRSASFSLSILTVAPAVPTALGLLASDDSGVVGDAKTNVRAPHVTGKAGAGVTVRVLAASGSSLGTGTAASDGSFVIALAGLPDGVTTLQAVALDAAANQSGLSVPFVLTIQTTVPATPGMPSLLAADDSGTIGDGKTNVRSPRLTVIAPAGLSVKLLDASGNALGSTTTATATSAGNLYTVAAGSNLADGIYSIRAVTTDIFGNTSLPSAPFNLTIATRLPVTLAAPTVLPADDTGVLGDGMTTVRRPRITGTAAAGNRVDWLDPSGNVVASATANPDGSYILQAARSFSNGTVAVAVRQVDAVGNMSTLSTPLLLTVRATSGDYFGDGKTDVSVYRPSNSTYYILKPTLMTLYYRGFGGSGDIPISGDFFGNGTGDLAVYRPSSSAFYALDPTTNAGLATTWGGSGDIPVPGDYDGDGKTDIAVFRPSTAVFYVRMSSTGGLYTAQWGGPGDIPVPGDYFGNGHTDIAVYRPSTAAWYYLDPITGQSGSQVWGGAGAGDTPVPADYDGDGKTDIAIFRPSTDTYYVQLSSTNKLLTRNWGISGDVPVAGDYFGGGRASFAVYRPGNSTFYATDPLTGAIMVQQFGATGDLPVQPPLTSNFNPNGSIRPFYPKLTANLAAVVPDFLSISAPVAAPSAPYPAATMTTRSTPKLRALDQALVDLGLNRWRPV